MNPASVLVIDLTLFLSRGPELRIKNTFYEFCIPKDVEPLVWLLVWLLKWRWLEKKSALIVGFFPQQDAMEFCVELKWTVRYVRRQHPVLSTRWVWTTAVKVFQCQGIIRIII